MRDAKEIKTEFENLEKIVENDQSPARDYREAQSRINMIIGEINVTCGEKLENEIIKLESLRSTLQTISHSLDPAQVEKVKESMGIRYNNINEITDEINKLRQDQADLQAIKAAYLQRKEKRKYIDCDIDR